MGGYEAQSSLGSGFWIRPDFAFSLVFVGKAIYPPSLQVAAMPFLYGFSADICRTCGTAAAPCGSNLLGSYGSTHSLNDADLSIGNPWVALSGSAQFSLSSVRQIGAATSLDQGHSGPLSAAGGIPYISGHFDRDPLWPARQRRDAQSEYSLPRAHSLFVKRHHLLLPGLGWKSNALSS